MKPSPFAFPGQEIKENGVYNTTVVNPGMTLRDYFAAKAMQTLLSKSKTEYFDLPLVSKRAYQIANNMLEEREKNGS
jgi:inner membrane protein involved in colicin E2 resistance